MPENRLDPREIETLAEQLTPEEIFLLPFYHELENELKQPDRIRVQTEYFWRYWAPELGPTLTALVITLRSYCYYNRITKEKRDWCYPKQEKLASDVGVSVDTIQRQLNRPIAHHFVRREPRYRYDPGQQKKVRTADMYHVAMDDPIHTDHASRLALLAAERLIQETSQPQHPEKPHKTSISPKPQSAAQGSGDNSSPKPQIAAYRATANRDSRTSTSKKYLTNVNVLQKTDQQKEKNVNHLAEYLAEELDNTKSLGLWRRFARLVPESTLHRALSETKDA